MSKFSGSLLAIFLCLLYVQVARADPVPPPPEPPDVPQPGAASGLSFEYFATLFEPIIPGHVFDLDIDPYEPLIESAPYASTFLHMAVTPTTVKYYFGVRVGMLAALWMIGWVMKKIGRPLPSEPVVVLGNTLGYVPRVASLPKLPPSGIYRRGRR
jgi:hypothetical protein